MKILRLWQNYNRNDQTSSPTFVGFFVCVMMGRLYECNKGLIMLNTTTHNIDGKEIKEYLGVVAGEAISGANFVKDFLASIKDFTGGRSGAYEEELSKARNIAFDEMNQKAREMGANGVVGIDIDYGTLGDTGSMLMVSVNGTAIKY